MPLCQAIHCNNRRMPCSDKSFFAIPNPEKDRGRCAIWLRNIGTTKHNIATYKYSKYRVVCEDHFDQSAFVEDKIAKALGIKPRKQLRPDAVPTIFGHKTYEIPKQRATTVRREEQRQQNEEQIQRHKFLSDVLGTSSASLSSEEGCVRVHEPPSPPAQAPGQEDYFENWSLTGVQEVSQTVDVCSIEEITNVIKPSEPPLKKKRFRKRSGHGASRLIDAGIQTDICGVVTMKESSSQWDPEVSGQHLFEYGTQVPAPKIKHEERVAAEHLYCATEPPTNATDPQEMFPPTSDENPEQMDIDEDIQEKKYQQPDPNYEPEDDEEHSLSSFTDEETEEEKFVKATKYIVFQDCLHELFYQLSCPRCGRKVVEIKEIPFGTMVKILAYCANEHEIIKWSSQPTINKMAVGNLLMAAATLFSGLTYKRMKDFHDYAGMKFISRASFYKYQTSVLLPVVNAEYEASVSAAQENTKTMAEDGRVVVCGDGRCDSPGHNATFGTYSMMDNKTNEIIATALVHVTEATSSNAMENVGFLRCMETLVDEGIRVDVMTTDRHVSIRASLKKDFPEVSHQFDVWHLTKSVKKKLVERSKRKGCKELGDWIQAISNHMWWSASNCGGDADCLVEMWTSVSHHITDTHQWLHGEKFLKCAHDELSPEERASVAWLVSGSPAHEALNEVVFDKTLLKDVRQITLSLHTGSLEQYHGLMLRYCPKRQFFEYPCMLARTQLAVIDHNHNSEREMIKDSTGQVKYTAVYQKATHRWVLRARYVQKDFCYVMGMMRNVLAFKLGNIELGGPDIPDLPPNIARDPRPSMEEMITKHKSRFDRKDN